jgi:hypothetical protein
MRKLGVTTLDADVKHVRSVAPHKEMLCVRFDVPRHVAFESISVDELTRLAAEDVADDDDGDEGDGDEGDGDDGAAIDNVAKKARIE